MMLKVFDVGHGQCILFITPNRRVVLIDCAHHPNGWHPADALLAMGIRHVHSLVISNFDEDHARGLTELLARGITLGQVWPNWRVSPATIRRLKNDLGSGIEFLLWMLDRGWGSTCDASDAPLLGCDTFTTWALASEDYSHSYVDTNRLSVITEIKTSGVGIMIGGDMPAMGWRILLRNPRFRVAVASTDILVASHHGREDGCCDELYTYGWRPGVVIMSDERQGHGTQDTGQYYRQRSRGLTFGDGETRHVLSTDRHGHIAISFPSFGNYKVEITRGFRQALPATPSYRLPQPQGILGITSQPRGLLLR
jgi:beta-lactamase superfamily II metal-dependent hydrolase